MYKPLVALIAVVAAVTGGVLLVSPNSIAQDEAGDFDSINAVMELDITPLIHQMRSMEMEVASMQESMAAMQKSLEEAQIMQAEVVEILGRLAPEKWDYEILHNRSEKALKEAGDNGWELVTISSKDEWLYLRRPARPEEAEETER